jgi:predicted ATP-dependent endonuclease of OLD family
LKIKVQKLGNIQDAEFDLRPLTIFVGPNNTGKTWLAYTLSAILGPYSANAYTQAYIEDQLPGVYPPLDDAVEQVVERGDTKIDLFSFAEKYGESYFNNIANLAKKWMSRFMSTQYSYFDEMNITIALDEMKANFLERIKAYSFRTNISNGLLTIFKKSGDNIIYAYKTFEMEDSEQTAITETLPAEETKKHLVRKLTQSMQESLYPNVRVFPTERTGIVPLNIRAIPISSSLSVEAIQESIKFLEKMKETPLSQIMNAGSVEHRSLIRPIRDFLNMLAELLIIDVKKREKRERRAKNNVNIQQYLELADILEKEILGGGIAFSTLEPDPRRIILFQPTQDASLEITIASSMVKELYSLVLYLRYLAEPGELIIIDEPEMNLHPLAQVKITEFLASLVNAGLHILITTHSTYVVDHLGNLMDAYKHENKSEIVDKFILQREDSFISQDKVSVYEVTESGSIDNILGLDGAINWQTFSDVTELVQRIHFEL